MRGAPVRRQTLVILSVALLLFVAVGASAKVVVPAGAEATTNARLAALEAAVADHGARIAELEAVVAELSGGLPANRSAPSAPTRPRLPADATTTTTTTTSTTTTTTSTTTTTTTAPSVARSPGGTTTTAPPADATGGRRLVFDRDTVVTEALVLRPGDSIELRNGAGLLFRDGGYADWQGTPTFTWGADGRKQNLERDIRIFGEGHVRFEAGSRPSIIRFVEFDLRPPQELAKYPLHFHFAGDGVRGTLVEGVVVRDSTNRAFVTHASNGITIRDSIAKNIVGEAFWWDLTTREQRQAGLHPNASNDIVWRRNLADGVFDTPLENNVRLAAFTLGDGRNNVLVDSVAMGVRSRKNKDCAGFTWPEGIGSRWVFRNNAAFGNGCHGIFVWQNSAGPHVIEGYRARDNGKSDVRHGAYRNGYVYRDIDVDRFVLLATGTRFEGGRIGTLVFQEHRLEGEIVFEGTRIGKVIVDNAIKGNNGGRHKPGTYVFDGTGLSFSDITVRSVIPGTTITIDGETRTYG